MRQVRGTRNEPVCSASTLPGPGISSVGWQGFSSLPRAIHGQQQEGAFRSFAFKSRLCFCMCADKVSSDPLNVIWSSSSLHSPTLPRAQCKKHLNERVMSRAHVMCACCVCVFFKIRAVLGMGLRALKVLLPSSRVIKLSTPPSIQRRGKNIAPPYTLLPVTQWWWRL